MALGGRVADSSALCCHLGDKGCSREPAASPAKKEKRLLSAAQRVPLILAVCQDRTGGGSPASPAEPGVSCRPSLCARPPNGTELFGRPKQTGRDASIPRDGNSTSECGRGRSETISRTRHGPRAVVSWWLCFAFRNLL